MLKVDLSRLGGERRIALHDEVPPDAELWEGLPATLHGPVVVEIELQRIGSDVLAKGTLRGEAELSCKRCLVDVVLPIDEQVEFLFRAGLTPEEAKREEAYALPDQVRDLDVSEPVREHLFLAVPVYAVCDEACRGLCPKCGARLNETTCDCEETDVDDRWAPLRKLQ